MTLWTDNTLRPIDDGEFYIDRNGNNWTNTPKAAIPGLMMVVETERPSLPAHRVTGYVIEMVEGVPTQVWQTEPRDPAEVETEAKAGLVNDALAILGQKTMERIQRAVVAGRTTWEAADVVTYCAYLDAVQAIATGKAPGPLPARPAYPAGT